MRSIYGGTPKVEQPITFPCLLLHGTGAIILATGWDNLPEYPNSQRSGTIVGGDVCPTRIGTRWRVRQPDNYTRLPEAVTLVND